MTQFQKKIIYLWFFFKYGANLGCFNIIGTFSSLFFEIKFPQKQHELTNCFFIIIILALLHFTDGKKKPFSISVFFQWILLLSQVGACLKIFQMEDLLCIIGGKKAIQGQILIQAGLCKYTELQPVKMRSFRCTLCSWNREAPGKKGEKC